MDTIKSKAAALSEYDKQAAAFMRKTGAVITLEYVGKEKHFPDDKEERDVYNVTLTRGKRSYTFRFGDSIVNTGKHEMFGLIGKIGPARIDYFWNYENAKARKVCEIGAKCLQWFGKTTQYDALKRCIEEAHVWQEPSDYSIITCLQKQDVGTFDDFCSEFGGDTDSIKARKTYEAVRDEYLNLAKLFTDKELEEMAEIQ